MNKRYAEFILIFIVFAIIGVILGVVVWGADPPYTISGDKVYIDDSNVFIQAQPHTIDSSQWVYFNFSSKVYTGDIDVAWGFNENVVRPTAIELYKPHTIYWNSTHTRYLSNVLYHEATTDECDFGFDYNNYKRRVYYQTYNENTTLWTNLSAVGCIDSYSNVSNDYQLTWHRENSKVKNWLDISSSMESYDFSYQNTNKWYVGKDVTINQDQMYLVRVYMNYKMDLGTQDGKYWFALKPSSKSLQQAIDDNQFYYLDPWYNASWLNRKNITFPFADNLLEPIVLTLSDVCGGKCNSNFSDIRIYDNTTATLLDYEFLNASLRHTKGTAETPVYVQFIVPNSSHLIQVYYNNSDAINVDTKVFNFTFLFPNGYTQGLSATNTNPSDVQYKDDGVGNISMFTDSTTEGVINNLTNTGLTADMYNAIFIYDLDSTDYGRNTYWQWISTGGNVESINYDDNNGGGANYQAYHDTTGSDWINFVARSKGWHTFEFKVNYSTKLEYWVDNTLRGTSTDNVPDHPPDKILFEAQFSNADDWYADGIRSSAIEFHIYNDTNKAIYSAEETGTPAVTDTCTPPAVNTNWDLTIDDNCTLSTNTNLGEGNLTVTGVGGADNPFIIEGNLTINKYIPQCTGGCKIVTKDKNWWARK